MMEGSSCGDLLWVRQPFFPSHNKTLKHRMDQLGPVAAEASWCRSTWKTMKTGKTYRSNSLPTCIISWSECFQELFKSIHSSVSHPCQYDSFLFSVVGLDPRYKLIGPISSSVQLSQIIPHSCINICICIFFTKKINK